MFDDPYSPEDLLSDVHSKDLHEDVSSQLRIAYLKDADKNSTSKSSGIVYGPHNRVFVATVLRKGGRSKYVHFLVDTGSPYTYICNEVLQSFNIAAPDPKTSIRIHLNDMPTTAMQSHGHFIDINLLGTDFMKTFGCVLTVDFEKGTASLVPNPD